MYRNCPEHPDIDRALRTGYPTLSDWEERMERHLMGHCYDGEGTYEEEYDFCSEEEEPDCDW